MAFYDIAIGIVFARKDEQSLLSINVVFIISNHSTYISY